MLCLSRDIACPTGTAIQHHLNFGVCCFLSAPDFGAAAQKDKWRKDGIKGWSTHSWCQQLFHWREWGKHVLFSRVYHIPEIVLSQGWNQRQKTTPQLCPHCATPYPRAATRTEGSAVVRVEECWDQLIDVSDSPWGQSRQIFPEWGWGKQGCAGLDTEMSQKCWAEETNKLVTLFSAQNLFGWRNLTTHYLKNMYAWQSITLSSKSPVSLLHSVDFCCIFLRSFPWMGTPWRLLLEAEQQICPQSSVWVSNTNLSLIIVLLALI